MTAEEESLLYFRTALITCLQDRSLPIEERFAQCAAMLGEEEEIHFSPAEAAQILEPLERMDLSWNERIRTLAEAKAANLEKFPLQAENLAVYFLHRQLAAALDDGFQSIRAQFALWAAQVITAVSGDANDLLEAARQFSAEIEYSDENLDVILEKLGGADGTDSIL